MIDNPQGSGSASADPRQLDEGAPAAAPMPPPPSYAPPLPPAAWGTAPPAARTGGMRWAAITLIVVFVIALAGGAGAFAANSYLSDTYSPQRAALNFFTAQQRGDVDAMMANATFLRGDGSYEQFFDRVGVKAMIDIAQNREISDVKILSTKVANSRTDLVDVSMTWAGAQHIYEYTVRKDATTTNYLFYSPWKVDIPDATIGLVLPNQSGAIQVDGMPLPSAPVTSIQAIAGFHSVEMLQTPFYDADSQTVSSLEDSPVITFGGKLSAAAVTAAGAAIRAGANACDVNTYEDCPGHTYRAPNRAGWVYFLNMPGYPEIDYTSYVFKYSTDITTGMTLVVPRDQGLIYANGTCAVTLLVNGNRTYHFKGTWGANLTWNNSTFTADVYPNCEKTKA